MANWCSNTVYFTGESSRLEAVRELFEKIEQQQNATKQWHLPEFVTAPNSFMLDIKLADQQISYQTMWMPNLEALREIADHYDLEFTSHYEEPRMRIKGEAVYHDGILTDTYSGYDLHAQYTFDSDKNAYVTDGIPLDIKKDITEAIEERQWHASRSLQPDAEPFETTSTITKKELNALYGELPPADLILKFAEHHNFNKAREVFDAWDEQSILKMRDYLFNSFRHLEELYTTRDKYLAMSFLIALIKEWDHNNRQEAQIKQEKPKVPEGGMDERLATRLKGVLPHIDLDGTDFTIDWRLRELRETDSPWNKLDFNVMDMAESGEEYYCLYNAADHTHYPFDDTITQLPENVVLLEIPYEVKLDPVAVAREYHIDPHDFVSKNPISANLKATVKPIAETGLAELVAENLRKEQGRKNSR